MQRSMKKRKKNAQNQSLYGADDIRRKAQGAHRVLSMLSHSAPERRNAAFNLLKFIKFHQNASNHPYSLNFTNFLE